MPVLWIIRRGMHLGVKGPEEVIRIYLKLFPVEYVRARARSLLATVFRERNVECERWAHAQW